MLRFRLSLTTHQRRELERRRQTAQQLGEVWSVKFILAVLAVAHYQTGDQAALVLPLSVAQVEQYAHQFLCYGCADVCLKKSPGRPPRLTKSEKRQLSHWLEQGPAACGFDGHCLTFAARAAVDPGQVSRYVQRLLHCRVIEKSRLQ